MLIKTVYMRSAATCTYIPQDYNYFSVKKCPTPVLAIMIWKNVREYNIITYLYRYVDARSTKARALSYILQCSYTHKLYLNLLFCSSLFCRISFIFKFRENFYFCTLCAYWTPSQCATCEYVYIYMYITYSRYLFGLYFIPLLRDHFVTEAHRVSFL